MTPRLTTCLDCGRLTKTSPCPSCRTYQRQSWRRTSRAVTAAARTCLVCGSTLRLTAHHLEPRRKGGKVLITLCGLCHNRYHGDKRAGRDTELVRAVESAPTSFVD